MTEEQIRTEMGRLTESVVEAARRGARVEIASECWFSETTLGGMRLSHEPMTYTVRINGGARLDTFAERDPLP